MKNNDFETGMAFFEQGNFGKALENFERCLRNDPQDGQALLMQARSLSQLERFEEALNIFEHLITFNPKNAEFYSEKGVILFKKGKSEEALKALDHALELEPSNPYRYSSRAYIRAKVQDVFGAMDDYQKAIELDPDDMIALNNLGMLEESLGFSSYKNRFEKVDKLLGRKPTNFDYNVQSKQDEKADISPEIEKKQENTPQKAETKPTYWGIIRQTLTSATTFSEFITFVKNKFQ